RPSAVVQPFPLCGRTSSKATPRHGARFAKLVTVPFANVEDEPTTEPARAPAYCPHDSPRRGSRRRCFCHDRLARRQHARAGSIIGRCPDGIVMTGVNHSVETRRRLLASGIPVVETWDLTPTPIDMLVGFSHTAVAEAVCRRLHEAGRRRLAVIAADDERAL